MAVLVAAGRARPPGGAPAPPASLLNSTSPPAAHSRVGCFESTARASTLVGEIPPRLAQVRAPSTLAQIPPSTIAYRVSGERCPTSTAVAVSWGRPPLALDHDAPQSSLRYNPVQPAR